MPAAALSPDGALAGGAPLRLTVLDGRPRLGLGLLGGGDAPLGGCALPLARLKAACVSRCASGMYTSTISCSSIVIEPPSSEAAMPTSR